METNYLEEMGKRGGAELGWRVGRGVGRGVGLTRRDLLRQCRGGEGRGGERRGPSEVRRVGEGERERGKMEGQGG